MQRQRSTPTATPHPLAPPSLHPAPGPRAPVPRRRAPRPRQFVFDFVAASPLHIQYCKYSVVRSRLQLHVIVDPRRRGCVPPRLLRPPYRVLRQKMLQHWLGRSSSKMTATSYGILRRVTRSSFGKDQTVGSGPLPVGLYTICGVGKQSLFFRAWLHSEFPYLSSLSSVSSRSATLPWFIAQSEHAPFMC